MATWRGLENPFEPESALSEAARYLAELRKEFGNLGLAAAAYNAGPTRLRDYLRHRRGLPAETLHYVLAVTGSGMEEWTRSTDHEIRPTLARIRNLNTRHAPLPVRLSRASSQWGNLCDQIPAANLATLAALRNWRARQIIADARQMPRPVHVDHGREVRRHARAGAALL